MLIIHPPANRYAYAGDILIYGMASDRGFNAREIYRVRPNTRFRLIGANTHCPISVRINAHVMHVVAVYGKNSRDDNDSDVNDTNLEMPEKKISLKHPSTQILYSFYRFIPFGAV